MENQIKEYIDYLAFERRNAKNTYTSYERDLIDYSLFLKQRNITDLNDVSRDDITKYIEFLNATNKNREADRLRRRLLEKYSIEINKL